MLVFKGAKVIGQDTKKHENKKREERGLSIVVN
jgi:hypothetical protein